MKFERARTLELLERRLELVRALIRVDAEWRRSFIGLNLDESERCAAEEERLSEQISAIDKEITSLEVARSQRVESNPARREVRAPQPVEVDPVTDRKIHASRDRMKALHLELKRSNEIRKSILKRSKITLNALRNLFNSHAPSYAAPAASATGTIYEERV